MAGGKGSTTSSQIKLSPEARRALTAEIGTFADRISPEQAALQSGLLKSVGPQQGGMVHSDVMGSLGVANAAVQNAGAQNGRVRGSDINLMTQRLQELQPAAADQLRQLGLGVASQANSIMDPRFAFSIRPDQLTNTKPGSGQQAAQAAQIALSIAAIVASLN